MMCVEVYKHMVHVGCFRILHLKLTQWHLNPLRASAFVPLPHWIQDKRAVVNVVGTWRLFQVGCIGRNASSRQSWRSYEQI